MIMPVGVYQRTEEHKRKLGEATKSTQFSGGHIPWNKNISWKRGKNKNPFPLEWRANLSKSLKGRLAWNKGLYGSKSPSWKGGKSKLTERIRVSEQYKQWRSDVYRRDGWTCQTCGFRGHGKDIAAHHILPVKEILKRVFVKGMDIDEQYSFIMSIPDLFDVSNGITLCKECHILTFKKQGEKNE